MPFAPPSHMLFAPAASHLLIFNNRAWCHQWQTIAQAGVWKPSTASIICIQRDCSLHLTEPLEAQRGTVICLGPPKRGRARTGLLLLPHPSTLSFFQRLITPAWFLANFPSYPCPVTTCISSLTRPPEATGKMTGVANLLISNLLRGFRVLFQPCHPPEVHKGAGFSLLCQAQVPVVFPTSDREIRLPQTLAQRPAFTPDSEKLQTT